MFRRLCASFVFIVLLPSVLIACYWDYDTLQMERSRFPSTLELITGKFLRHSKGFYEWRITDRLKKLESDPNNLALYDDLAVAYDKIGEPDKAIETILKKNDIKPGLYETEANLGTFYIHSGQLDKGIAHIQRALEINPNAHFGREKYQTLLVEYVRSRSLDAGIKLPLGTAVNTGSRIYDHVKDDFAEFLFSADDHRNIDSQERQAALRGIEGMMKFGQHDSPILLEALASLLSSGHTDVREEDAKHLAARAYLKASYEVEDQAAKDAYRELAESVVGNQTIRPNTEDSMTLEQVEAEFAAELKDAEAWYAEVEQNEKAWIAAGKNPEVEFTRLYYEEPMVRAEFSSTPFAINRGRWVPVVIVGSILLCAALGTVVVFVVKRKRGNKETEF